MNRCLKDFNYFIIYPTDSRTQVFDCDKCMKESDPEDPYAGFGDCFCPTTEPGDDIFQTVHKALNEASFSSKRRRKTRGFCKHCRSINHHSSVCQNKDGLDQNFVRSDKRSKVIDRKVRSKNDKKTRKGKWMKKSDYLRLW